MDVNCFQIVMICVTFDISHVYQLVINVLIKTMKSGSAVKGISYPAAATVSQTFRFRAWQKNNRRHRECQRTASGILGRTGTVF